MIEWRRRTDRNSHEGEKGAYIGHGENNFIMERDTQQRKRM